MDPIVCFPKDFADARRRFLDAAEGRGAVLDKKLHPMEGPEGESLYLDVARIGPADATEGLLVLCGTHGAEGLAGSGCETALLNDDLLDWLPKNFALLLVHAVNPFGMAWMRRANEDNVDLNRNFLDHRGDYPANPDYAELADAVCPPDLTDSSLREADHRLEDFRRRHGEKRMQSAVCSGQYEYPDGLFYGGCEAAWSNRTVREIATRTLTECRSAAIIDLHTGLGAFGQGELICACGRGETGFERAQSWWGSRVRSTRNEESVSVPLHGSLLDGLQASLPDADTTGVTLEFGTYPIFDVLRALRLENWAYTHDRRQAEEGARARRVMRRVFYPDAPAWRRGIYQQFRTVFIGAVNGLTGWR